MLKLTKLFYSTIPLKLADGLNLKAFLDAELTSADKLRIKTGMRLRT